MENTVQYTPEHMYESYTSWRRSVSVLLNLLSSCSPLASLHFLLLSTSCFSPLSCLYPLPASRPFLLFSTSCLSSFPASPRFLLFSTSYFSSLPASFHFLLLSTSCFLPLPVFPLSDSLHFLLLAPSLFSPLPASGHFLLFSTSWFSSLSASRPFLIIATSCFSTLPAPPYFLFLATSCFTPLPESLNFLLPDTSWLPPLSATECIFVYPANDYMLIGRIIFSFFQFINIMREPLSRNDVYRWLCFSYQKTSLHKSGSFFVSSNYCKSLRKLIFFNYIHWSHSYIQ